MTNFNMSGTLPTEKSVDAWIEKLGYSKRTVFLKPQVTANIYFYLYSSYEREPR